jgi:quinol monooxygenase YgiN
MITIMFRMMTIPGHEADAVRMCKELMASTRAEDDGCVNYTVYRRADNPLELLLFEQWRDQPALDAHLARLRNVYGPADEHAQEPPRRRIPKAILAHSERVEAVRYEELG